MSLHHIVADTAPLQRQQPMFAPQPVEQRNLFLRSIAVRVIASVRKRSASDIAMERWPSDRALLEVIERASSAPAMTTVTGWAKELAATRVADAIGSLGMQSAAAELFAGSLMVDFGGAASITVPRFAADANFASFVAEGDPIPVNQLVSTGAVLLPYKLATIAALTREMIESSNAETLIGDAFIRSCGLALDARVFSNAAVSTAAPAGLINGIAQTTASNNSDSLYAAMEDLVALVNAVAAVAGNGMIFIVANPGRLVGLGARLPQGVPRVTFLGSYALSTTIVAVAANGLVAALDPDPTIETSNASALVMANPATSGPQRSMFQTDTIALRVRWPVSWILRDPGAVAWTTPSWK